MAVTGIENVSAVGELEGEGVSGGVGEDKAGKPYFQGLGEIAAEAVFIIQFVGQDLTDVLKEQAVVE